MQQMVSAKSTYYGTVYTTDYSNSCDCKCLGTSNVFSPQFKGKLRHGVTGHVLALMSPDSVRTLKKYGTDFIMFRHYARNKRTNSLNGRIAISYNELAICTYNYHLGRWLYQQLALAIRKKQSTVSNHHSLSLQSFYWITNSTLAYRKQQSAMRITSWRLSATRRQGEPLLQIKKIRRLATSLSGRKDTVLVQ